MKRIFWLALVLFVMLSTTAFAHSNLTSSTPSDGEVVDGNLKELKLQFDTSIENTSSLTLLSENGEQIPVTISVNTNTLVAQIPAPLKNGTYEVDWKVIGEDGHQIDGTYLFMVNTAETSTDVSTNDGGGLLNTWVVIAICVIVLIILLTVLSKRRR
nr:copper resistance protein CopC [Lysinibacillus timonensis]